MTLNVYALNSVHEYALIRYFLSQTVRDIFKNYLKMTDFGYWYLRV